MPPDDPVKHQTTRRLRELNAYHRSPGNRQLTRIVRDQDEGISCRPRITWDRGIRLGRRRPAIVRPQTGAKSSAIREICGPFIRRPTHRGCGSRPSSVHLRQRHLESTCYLSAGTISARDACHAGISPANTPTSALTAKPVVASEIEGRKAIRIPSVPSARLLVRRMTIARPTPTRPPQRLTSKLSDSTNPKMCQPL